MLGDLLSPASTLLARGDAWRLAHAECLRPIQGIVTRPCHESCLAVRVRTWSPRPWPPLRAPSAPLPPGRWLPWPAADREDVSALLSQPHGSGADDLSRPVA